MFILLLNQHVDHPLTLSAGTLYWYRRARTEDPNGTFPLSNSSTTVDQMSTTPMGAVRLRHRPAKSARCQPLRLDQASPMVQSKTQNQKRPIPNQRLPSNPQVYHLLPLPQILVRYQEAIPSPWMVLSQRLVRPPTFPSLLLLLRNRKSNFHIKPLNLLRLLKRLI